LARVVCVAFVEVLVDDAGTLVPVGGMDGVASSTSTALMLRYIYGRPSFCKRCPAPEERGPSTKVQAYDEGRNQVFSWATVERGLRRHDLASFDNEDCLIINTVRLAHLPEVIVVSRGVGQHGFADIPW
jgi:hypothetical protein